MISTDDVWMATDSVSADIAIKGGATVTDSVEWETVPTFTPNAVTDAHKSFFGVDSFYQFETTVAKSVPQTYFFDEDEYTFIKPPDELQKATWTVDNAPFTLQHPPLGRVTQDDEIHGVFHDSYFSPLDASINSTLSVPATDDAALSYLAENDNISIGFYNQLSDVSDDADVDAEQRNIVVDHVAGVETGRCAKEDGCQIRM